MVRFRTSGLGLNRERGFTLLELLIVILVLALILIVALVTFAGQDDAAKDAQAQANVTTAFRVARAEHIDHGRSYPPAVHQMVEQLEETEKSLLFHDYADHTRPSLGPLDISVTLEDENMISFCARSDTGRYYCIRGDELAKLKPPASDDDQTADSGGTLLAAIGPLSLLFPETAYAVSGPPFRTGSDYTKVSRCTAWTEPDARACLATRELEEGADRGPDGTGTPGWVDEDDLPPPPEDPWKPGDPLPGDDEDNEGAGDSGDDTGDGGDPSDGTEDPGDGEDPGDDTEQPDDGGDDSGIDDPGDGGDPSDGTDDPGDGDTGGDDTGDGGSNQPQQFELLVGLSGEGTGMVTGPGIDCPGDCREVYDAGTQVTLQASPGSYSQFTGWAGSCTGQGAVCHLTMNNDREAIAGFEVPDPYAAAFDGADVLAAGDILVNSNGRIDSGVHLDGDITLSSNAVVCGDLRHGGSYTAHSNAQHICGQRSQGPLMLEPVDQGTVAQNNDNWRFFSHNPMGPGANQWNTIWNPQTRRLTLYANGSVIVNSGVYSFCRLEVSSNAQLLIAPGADVTIYFDSPESCGIQSWEAQLQLYSNSQITTTADHPDTRLRLLFVGSSFGTSKIDLSSNTALPEACKVPTMIYAPLSDATVQANATFCGQLAVRNLTVRSNARIKGQG